MFSTQEDIWVYSLAVYTQGNTHAEYTRAQTEMMLCWGEDGRFIPVVVVKEELLYSFYANYTISCCSMLHLTQIYTWKCSSFTKRKRSWIFPLASQIKALC